MFASNCLYPLRNGAGSQNLISVASPHLSARPLPWCHGLLSSCEVCHVSGFPLLCPCCMSSPGDPIPHTSPVSSCHHHPCLFRRPRLSVLSLTSVSPHVALEIKGIVEALATAVAHVTPSWAVAFEVPGQHALQWEGLGAERAAKCSRAPGSRGQCSL